MMGTQEDLTLAHATVITAIQQGIASMILPVQQASLGMYLQAVLRRRKKLRQGIEYWCRELPSLVVHSI